MRDRRVDSLRAVAILAVVLGHAILRAYSGDPASAPPLAATAFTLAAAIGVPVFVFLSGWVARPEADLRWVGGRAMRLLVPYGAWVVVQWLLRVRGGPTLAAELLNPSLTDALWFLPALFLCSAAFAALRRWDALLVVAAVAAALFSPSTALFGISRAVEQFPYFVAGYYARRRASHLQRLAPAAPALMLLAWQKPGIALQWAAPWWYGTWQRIAQSLPRTLFEAPVRLAHFSAVFSLLAVGWSLAVALHHHAPPVRALAPAWGWLGRNTLGVYAGHILVLRLFTDAGMPATPLFVAALAGGVVITLAISLWPPAAAVLLGTVRSRPKAPPPPADDARPKAA